MSKFDPLGTYLSKQTASVLVLSFSEIEKIIGEKLCYSAYNYNAYIQTTLGALNGGVEGLHVDAKVCALFIRMYHLDLLLLWKALSVLLCLNYKFPIRTCQGRI